ncbi:hypothetical protein Acr_06g0014220 [Actinidia rufa]|uniref:Uncharacterized protein n=1 Tax=Actinidia rufa TaxID=165716 RepID=A0A7J0ET09_9ERIC|nr:hypothetical protein Acr_06g0014220 [Actinidia rufa]
MGSLGSFLGAVVAVQSMWHPGVVAFLVMDAIILIAASSLMTVQATQIARNITTNEAVNAVRYGYLRTPEGRFHNPYSHGCRKNCADFLIHGYTDDNEIAWHSLQEALDDAQILVILTDSCNCCTIYVFAHLQTVDFPTLLQHVHKSS